MTQKEGFEKMAKYCAYQERCMFEVRQKLFGSGLSSEEIENIICDLLDQNFINEERYAKAFARGKFYQKKWGKLKIKQHLKQKQISEYCIKLGLNEINQSDYLMTLEYLKTKKYKEVVAENNFIKKQKTANYLIGKGYESELVWETINP